MTPAEKAVIDAARAWADGLTDVIGEDSGALFDAVEALDVERAEATKTRPWSRVVAEDEVYSEVTKRWHLVYGTLRDADMIAVELDGASKPIMVKADARVQVRRSEMGKAVDVWAGVEVVSS